MVISPPNPFSKRRGRSCLESTLSDEPIVSADRPVEIVNGNVYRHGGIFRTAVASYAIAGLGVISGIVLARALGADGRGTLAALQSWPAIFALLFTLGLPEG